MMKANTIIAAFALIMLMSMTSLVNAGHDSERNSTPRATVSISQTEFSASETDKPDTASIKSANSSSQKNSGINTRNDTNLAENTAADETTPSSAEPADAKTIASLSAGGGSSNVTADGDDDVAAGAAPVFLGSADDTCMGSSGAGGQGAAFGFSLGSTWTDENCKMLKNARELKSHGHHAAAKARLCMDENNALAFELAGEPCPRALPSAQAALWTIRQQNPSYQAATAHSFQVAALSGVTGRNNQPSAESQNSEKVSSLASPSEEEEAVGSEIGTLIAMVISAVNQVTSGVSPDFDGDLNGAAAMDGIE
jgi:hypothetical protein